MNLDWYVLRSKPNKEMTLWRELSARGLECFFPTLRVRPVNPRSRTVQPYFPGYLFLHTNLEQAGISLFQWMPFSSGLLAFDDVPATVPQAIIQGIRRHVDMLNQAGVERVSGLKRGDPVVIQGGPFHGYEAIFDARLPGTERVRVLLKLISARHMNLELPADQIERARVAHSGKLR